MKQLRLFAPVAGPEGYSIFARDLLTHLVEAGVHICLEEFKNWGPWKIQPTQRQAEAIKVALANKPYSSPKAITNLNICLPTQGKTIDSHRNVLYSMFEVDRIPDPWTEAMEYMDEILVPTEFNEASFSKGIPTDKIKVLPIGYDPTRYNPEVEPLPLKSKKAQPSDFEIRFLVICEITNRKNFLGTLQTFFAVATKIGADRCCLVLKIANYSSSLSIKEYISSFRSYLIAAGSIPDQQYHIFYYQPLISEDLHPAFLKIGTHYLSTSFGEGWDLTAMQAAACGLHLFVPFNSAYQCWLDQSVCTFLPIARKDLAFMPPPLDKFYEGAYWSCYDHAASVNIIAHAIAHPQISKKKQLMMRGFLKRYSWESLLPKYLEALHLC